MGLGLNPGQISVAVQMVCLIVDYPGGFSKHKTYRLFGMQQISMEVG